MGAKIKLPDFPHVAAELPLYATVPPAWNAERVGELSARLGVRGDAKDEGVWFVVRDGKSTLEIYQASHSLRLQRDEFDAEARKPIEGKLDRERAIAVAQRFHEMVASQQSRPEVHSVSELEVQIATREKPAPRQSVVGLQVNLRYVVDGLPLVGPGAKAQVTVGRDGEIGQAYRFWREFKQEARVASVQAGRALERFAATPLIASLPESASVEVTSIQLGLLCLPPSEAQGVLVPAYVVRGEISTELLPRYQFVRYVAAAEIDETDAKRRRWSSVRPSLLAA